MTLVMNQLLDSKLTEYHEQEEDALVLWDCVSLFDAEEEGSMKQGKTSETDVTTRSERLLKEDNSILPKNKRFQANVKKIQKDTIADKILEFTITSQNPKKINMPINPVEEKIDNVKKNL